MFLKLTSCFVYFLQTQCSVASPGCHCGICAHCPMASLSLQINMIKWLLSLESCSFEQKSEEKIQNLYCLKTADHQIRGCPPWEHCGRWPHRSHLFHHVWQKLWSRGDLIGYEVILFFQKKFWTINLTSSF